MFKNLWIIGVVLLMFSSLAKAGDFFSDPTYGGKYHWSTAYGLQHAIIQGVVDEGTEGIRRLGGPEWLPKVGKTLGCVGWFVSENNPFKNLDSVLDWVSPCAVAYFYQPGWWYDYDKERGFMLLPTNDGASINWIENF